MSGNNIENKRSGRERERSRDLQRALLRPMRKLLRRQGWGVGGKRESPEDNSSGEKFPHEIMNKARLSALTSSTDTCDNMDDFQ